MPPHLDVLRGEQSGGRPGSVPRHVDEIEAREPVCVPDAPGDAFAVKPLQQRDGIFAADAGHLFEARDVELVGL